MSVNPEPDPVAARVLSSSELADIASFGVERATELGDCSFRPGDADYDLFVVLEGEVQVVAGSRTRSSSPRSDPAGLWRADAAHRTAPLPDRRVTRPGRVLVIEQSEFRRLMSVRPALAETISPRWSPDASACARAGSQHDSGHRVAVLAPGDEPAGVRRALSASPHAWIDLEDAEDVSQLLSSMGLRPQDTPVVITRTECCAGPPRRRSRTPSGSRSSPHRASSSTSSSWAAAPPASPPPSTAQHSVRGDDNGRVVRGALPCCSAAG